MAHAKISRIGPGWRKERWLAGLVQPRGGWPRLEKGAGNPTEPKPPCKKHPASGRAEGCRTPGGGEREAGLHCKALFQSAFRIFRTFYLLVVRPVEHPRVLGRRFTVGRPSNLDISEVSIILKINSHGLTTGFGIIFCLIFGSTVVFCLANSASVLLSSFSGTATAAKATSSPRRLLYQYQVDIFRSYKFAMA